MKLKPTDLPIEIRTQLGSSLIEKAADLVIDMVASSPYHSTRRQMHVVVRGEQSSFVIATCDDQDSAEVIVYALRVLIGHVANPLPLVKA